MLLVSAPDITTFTRARGSAAVIDRGTDVREALETVMDDFVKQHAPSASEVDALVELCFVDKVPTYGTAVLDRDGQPLSYLSRSQFTCAPHVIEAFLHEFWYNRCDYVHQLKECCGWLENISS